MPIHHQIQAWRQTRNYSIPVLAEKAGIRAEDLEAMESGKLDPSDSTRESLACGLGIPASWLDIAPATIKLLLDSSDEEGVDGIDFYTSDPVTKHIFRGYQQYPELYVLFTTLLQGGEPKLLRAAEVNLRSLLKQAKTASVPWQSRPPGHFEPPSD